MGEGLKLIELLLNKGGEPKMSANKNFDNNITVNVNVSINIGNENVQNNATINSNNTSNKNDEKKSKFLEVLAKIVGFIKGLVIKLIRFIQSLI